MKEKSRKKKEYDMIHLIKTQYILDAMFLLTQRWSNIIDKKLKEKNLTATQLLFLLKLDKGFSKHPSFTEVGEAMSISHQNVKQIAKILEKKELLEIYQDAKDRRTKRIALHYETKKMLINMEQEKKTIAELFDVLSEKEVEELFSVIKRLEMHSYES